MKRILVNASPFPKSRLQEILEENRIMVNRYAEKYFAHPGFVTETFAPVTVTVMSLRELGFENGASLDDLFRALPGIGLSPCPVQTGLFLRIAWKDQPQSRNTVLSGTHSSPDGAVTVLSDILEQDDAFPKGLYLRNVEGRLWLRGYVCESGYRFSGGDLFAFDTAAPQG